MLLVPPILTERGVHLVPLEEKHLETVRVWRSSPEVSKYMLTEGQISAERQKAWFEKILASKQCLYWLIEKDGRSLGVAGLTDLEPSHQRGSLGWYIADPESRGQGIGTTVEFLLLSYFFDTLKQQKLCCEVLDSNPAIRVYLKFGFQQEGLRKRHVCKEGTFQDVIELALFREQWNSLKPDLISKLDFKG